MSMIFKFRMLSDEDDNFLRDYEVPYDMNLLDFHHFICDDLHYDPQNMSSFFRSDAQWNRLDEFTLMDMGDDAPASEYHTLPMEQVGLGQLLKKNHERLIYLFDMLQERALFLELMGTSTSNPTMSYPRVLLANGQAPDQFDPNASIENHSIFDEAMDEFTGFEGDDSYDDEN